MKKMKNPTSKPNSCCWWQLWNSIPVSCELAWITFQCGYPPPFPPSPIPNPHPLSQSLHLYYPLSPPLSLITWLSDKLSTTVLRSQLSLHDCLLWLFSLSTQVICCDLPPTLCQPLKINQIFPGQRFFLFFLFFIVTKQARKCSVIFLGSYSMRKETKTKQKIMTT